MKYTKYKLIGGLEQAEISSVSEDIKKVLSTEQTNLIDYEEKIRLLYKNQELLEKKIKKASQHEINLKKDMEMEIIRLEKLK